MMYSSLLVKMVFCLVATLLYLLIGGKDVNKAGILASLALYVVYTYIEVKVLMRLSKNQRKMAKKEAPLEYLRQFIPDPSAP